ncbi:MAG: DMT family transporter [Acidimicrobiia bacterium]|nr:DMT family transporter [Acidimicrobiia bacterium]
MNTRLLTSAHGTNRAAFSPTDWGLFLGLSAIWGASFLFMAIGLDAFHPGLVTLLRVGFGATFMLAIRRTRDVRVERADWASILLLSVIWVAIPFTLFPLAQQWIDSGAAGMLNGATPIFTAVVASFLLKQLPGRIQIAGLITGFVGIVAIAVSSSGGERTALIGVLLVVAATIGYAFSTNIVAPLQQKYGSIPIMARLLWVATILVAPYGLYGLEQSRFAWPSLLAVLAVGVLGTGLAFVMMGSLVGSVGPTRAIFITYLIPVVALILGSVFRDESVVPLAVVGVGLVIAGALLASRSEV